MPLVPPQGYLKIANIHRRGLLSARPVAADVPPGTLYYSSDSRALHRSTGAAWESYGDSGLTVLSSGQTGVQNNWAPGLVGNTYIVWTGPSDLIVSGISGGVAGQILIFTNQGANVAYFAHQSGSSSAINRFSNLVTIGDTPVAPRGNITFIHDGSDWILIGHEQGAWIDIPFNALDFTLSGGGTWTVDAPDVTSYAYCIEGSNIKVSWYIGSTTVATAACQALQIQLPNGYTAVRYILMPCVIQDNGGATLIGYCQSVAAGSLIQIFRPDSAAWAVSADNTGTWGELIAELS